MVIKVEPEVPEGEGKLMVKAEEQRTLETFTRALLKLDAKRKEGGRGMSAPAEVQRILAKLEPDEIVVIVDWAKSQKLSDNATIRKLIQHGDGYDHWKELFPAEEFYAKPPPGHDEYEDIESKRQWMCYAPLSNVFVCTRQKHHTGPCVGHTSEKTGGRIVGVRWIEYGNQKRPDCDD